MRVKGPVARLGAVPGGGGAGRCHAKLEELWVSPRKRVVSRLPPDRARQDRDKDCWSYQDLRRLPQTIAEGTVVPDANPQRRRLIWKLGDDWWSASIVRPKGCFLQVRRMRRRNLAPIPAFWATLISGVCTRSACRLARLRRLCEQGRQQHRPHRRAARPVTHGFQRMVRGLSRRALVHIRREAQCATNWSHPHGERTRCYRCCPGYIFRPLDAHRL